MTFQIDLAAMVLAQPRVLFPAVGAVIIGGGAQTTGAMTAAAAVGSLLAGVFSGPLGRVHAQGRAIAWAVVGWGLAISAFGGVLVMAAHASGASRTSVLWPALAAAAGPQKSQVLVASGLDDLNHMMSRYRWYPVLQIGISYRF